MEICRACSTICAAAKGRRIYRMTTRSPSCCTRRLSWPSRPSRSVPSEMRLSATSKRPRYVERIRRRQNSCLRRCSQCHPKCRSLRRHCSDTSTNATSPRSAPGSCRTFRASGRIPRSHPTARPHPALRSISSTAATITSFRLSRARVSPCTCAPRRVLRHLIGGFLTHVDIAATPGVQDAWDMIAFWKDVLGES